VAATARLWRLVFPAANRVIGPVDLGPEDWPGDLRGPRPEHAAFAWLDAVPGAHAWLGDEDAHALARAAGVAWAAPPPALTRTVHDKAFAVRTAAHLGLDPRPLRDLALVLEPGDLHDPTDALAAIETRLATWPAWTDGRFVLKPRLGSSGRGRVAGSRDAIDRSAIRGALPRLAARGGAILEPWLVREADLSVSLYVAPPDERDRPGVTLVGSLEPLLTPSGVPLGHLGEIDARGRVVSAHADDEAVRAAAAALATAVRETGWFGACGVDAMVFRAPDERGRSRTWLRPVVELNARPTLGLVAIGMLRRLLARIRSECGLSPGERRGFCFALAPPGGHTDWTHAARAAGTDAVAFTLAGPAPGPGVVVARNRSALAPLVAGAAARGEAR